MTQEDKQLLLTDLCARFPYGVKVRGVFLNYNKDKDKILYEECDNVMRMQDLRRFDTLKPYLRAMADMTEDEKEELLKSVFRRSDSKLFKVTSNGIDALPVELPANSHMLFSVNSVNFNNRNINKYTEFLNRHHFDYRGLIKKGLAIRVTEKNNPYKNN